MTQIDSGFSGQTVICTFDVTPGTAHDVVDALQDAYRDVISKAPGYVSGALHLNDAQTRVATYSQWRQRGDYQAMLRSPEMRERNRAIHNMCRSFEPVMYEVVSTW